MKDQDNVQNKSVMEITYALVVGLYAWFTSVSFGLVLMDILYAGLAPEATKAIKEAADFLLLLNSVTILAALVSIGLSWNLSSARNFLIASLSMIILGFFLYMLLLPVLKEGSITGTAIRITISGSVSILAFMGFYSFASIGNQAMSPSGKQK